MRRRRTGAELLAAPQKTDSPVPLMRDGAVRSLSGGAIESPPGRKAGYLAAERYWTSAVPSISAACIVLAGMSSLSPGFRIHSW